MRKIKFRGKRIDNGEWVYGFLYVSNISGCYILQCVSFAKKTKAGMNIGDKVVEFEVNPETVGQYTGLKDKNGVEIYEGDVVSSYGKVFKAVVEFENGIFQPFNDRDTCIFYADECEILGNIHNNPELLGGAE